jgi:hypothetical protein
MVSWGKHLWMQARRTREIRGDERAKIWFDDAYLVTNVKGISSFQLLSQFVRLFGMAKADGIW